MTDQQRKEILQELGMLGYMFLWLLGRPLTSIEPKTEPGAIQVIRTPISLWKVEVCDNVWVYRPYGPNVFHRLMQRLAFGVHWHCLV